MQRRCFMDSRHIGFVALSMRVLNTTPGFQDSSNPHESSRTPSEPGVKAGSDELELNDSVAKLDVGAIAAVSNLGMISGAIDFG